MAETYCGKNCLECTQREVLACKGCKSGPGRKFGGDCELAQCVMEKGHETCDTCSFKTTCSRLGKCETVPEERLRRIEAETARKAEMAKQAPLLGKWLWIVFWLIIPSTVASIMTNQTLVQYVPGMNIPGQILNAICYVLYGIALLKLAPAEEFYKKAGICALITCTVSTVVAISSGVADIAQAPTWTLILTIPAAIVGVVGEYYVYISHATVLDGIEQEMSEKWRKLWKWYIGLFLGMFGCVVIILIFPILGLLALIGAAIGIVVVDILKLVYLYRTAKIFKDFAA